ncbi:MAG: hypothetical protein ABI977_16685 [Acidobacteriota bacterium]
MSGTKFRLVCASCDATFFSPDRRARYCPKCAKKKSIGSPAKTQSPAGHREGAAASNPRPRGPLLPLGSEKKPAPKPKAPLRPPKTIEPTPEQLERIAEFYNEHCLNKEFVWKETIAKLSDEMWLARGAVAIVMDKLHRRKHDVAPETKARIIEMYKGYVERGERPAGGRRKTIAHSVGLPYAQVRDIVYEYSTARFSESPAPQPTREQHFQLEKLFYAEVDRARYRWAELAEKLAEQSGLFNLWQVARWMDMLFDDEKEFVNQPDVSPAIRQKILEAYQQYLSAPQPPERGLHSTIAGLIGDITPKQVHKVLQQYRSWLRNEYPLK